MQYTKTILLLLGLTGVSNANLRGGAATPTGTYMGSKTVIGQTVELSVSVVDTNVLSFQISGAAKVDCPSEKFNMDGDDIVIPGATQKGDCLGDALKSAKISLSKATYHSNDDTVDVSVKYEGFLTETLTLTKKSQTKLFAAAAGACTSADISLLVKADFAGDMKACGKKCWGGSSCVSKCMSDKEGISSACANCFGAEAQCTRDHCMAKCSFSPDSDACKQCAIKNCQSAETTCSGYVPTTDIPSMLFN